MWTFWRKRTPEEQRNDAYIVYSEWGPQLRIPHEKRLVQKFPRTDPATQQGWVSDFKNVEKTVHALAEQGGRKVFTTESFAAKMHELHPWMNRKAIKRAWFLICYFAWHEGYDR